jgi:hypothetical protein
LGIVPVKTATNRNKPMSHGARTGADDLAVLAVTKDVLDVKFVVGGEGFVDLIAMAGCVWLMELDSTPWVVKIAGCAVERTVWSAIFVPEGLVVEPVAADCDSTLATFVDGDADSLSGVVLCCAGGAGSRDPSMCLYQLLFGSSKHSPTVTALKPLVFINLSIVSVILLTVSELVSWPMTSILSESGFDFMVRFPEKSLIEV